MDFLTIWSLFGFLFAVYAVTANDSIQTLGTFISSNRDDVKWYWMFAYMGSIFAITMLIGFFGGDPAFERLDHLHFFPETENPDKLSDELRPRIVIEWYHALAPLVLILLTRLKIPVSTTFLVLSIFAISTDNLMEEMLEKSFLGYAVSFVFAFSAWYLITKYILYEGDKGDNKYNFSWRVFQWITTGYLWATWLNHDMANILVFLPRYGTDTATTIFFPLLVIGAMLLGLGFMFYERGGKIQEIVLSKTNTRYIRSATLIDLVYCFVLVYFKEMNSIPMSTTFVFMGMLAGRETAIWFVHGYGKLTYTDKKMKGIFPMLYSDFMRLMLGLAVSVTLAYGILWYSNL